MKITTVKYEKLFPTGSYLNERIGMEATLDDEEDEHKVLQLLKNLVENFHVKSNPQLADTITAPVPEMQVDRGLPNFALENDMNTCTEIKVLETYKFLIRGNEYL